MGGGAEDAPKDINGIKLIARRRRCFRQGSCAAGRGNEAAAWLGRVVVLTEADGKATVAAGVTQDPTARVTAVELVQAATAALGGKGGGGRPDRAQGGAPALAAADAAIAAVEALIRAKA